MSIGVPTWLDAEVSVDEVDEDAARVNLDELARGLLGMSGDEFQRRRAEGSLDEMRECPGFSRVLAVARLLDSAS